jgi:integrase/recombinase XerD
MTASAAPTKFRAAADTYLSHYRALGYRYRGHACILTCVGRHLHKIGAKDLDAGGYASWCQSMVNNHPNSRRKAQQIVRRFCLFRARTESAFFVPSFYSLTKMQPYIRPVIITPEQVGQVLAVADRVLDQSGPPMKAAVHRIAIVLLYTAGLRMGELLRLQVTDVENGARVLRIRESKFHKSRLVPLSRSAQVEVKQYLQTRGRFCPEQPDRGPLLCNRKGGHLHGYGEPGIGSLVQRLFDRAKVRDVEGRRPRFHDLRHSFAVQSLIRIYRAKGDVQSALPKLALYMGHVSVESTLHYVRLVPEVAALASGRFEEHFGHWVQGGAS